MPVNKTSRTVQISLPTGESAEIYYYGATVTSWIAGGKERLFVSSKAALDGSKPIRGGIPICWPIFGPPPKEADESLQYHAKLSQHGFARNHNWTLQHVVMDRPEGVSVRFVLDPTPEIVSIFPHPFHLTYVVTLTKHELCTDIHVVNPSPTKSLTGAVSAAVDAVTSALPASVTGSESKVPQSVDDAAQHELKFQALFHTYLAVDDASKVKIKGLKQGLTYLDKVGPEGWTERTWEGGDLVIDKQVDRVYYGLGKNEDVVLEDGPEKLTVHRVALTDVTTWNPTAEAGAGIADMEPNGWDKYVCIEPGYVKNWKTLAPGEEWIGQQVLKIAGGP
ncbi:hypothetical protein QFC24_005594 [Naganishia onofrii]|uniref:Uncharacterized protein n=1 Tax=Naganishia onofrii TaxID=1851511 RepID=A0ACC2X922_9TREE|nr:hypothetical protein QFC24_005594 [Naganishia onofrii]